MSQTFEMLRTEALSVELTTRTHRLTPPRGAVDKLGRWAQDVLEAGVARASRYGDPMVYHPGQFPWVRQVEADWRKVRAELDQVMTRRDRIPSFQEILKEVSLIQTDHNWKSPQPYERKGF